MRYYYHYFRFLLPLIYWKYVAKSDFEKRVYGAMLFCLKKHHSVGQMYDGYPYYLHLNKVMANALRFRDCLSGEEQQNAFIIALGHDLIEDTRMNFSDVKVLFGGHVAEAIFLCTDLRGRDRKEKHSSYFFKELKKNKVASYVKLCDFLANVQYCVEKKNSTDRSKLIMYLREYPKYKNEIREQEFNIIFDEIEKILGL